MAKKKIHELPDPIGAVDLGTSYVVVDSYDAINDEYKTVKLPADEVGGGTGNFVEKTGDTMTGPLVVDADLTVSGDFTLGEIDMINMTGISLSGIDSPTDIGIGLNTLRDNYICSLSLGESNNGIETYKNIGMLIRNFTNPNYHSVTIAEDMILSPDIFKGITLYYNVGLSKTGIQILEDSILLRGLDTYADNATAIAGGLAVDTVYKTATGELRIVI